MLRSLCKYSLSTNCLVELVCHVSHAVLGLVGIILGLILRVRTRLRHAVYVLQDRNESRQLLGSGSRTNDKARYTAALAWLMACSAM